MDTTVPQSSQGPSPSRSDSSDSESREQAITLLLAAVAPSDSTAALFMSIRRRRRNRPLAVLLLGPTAITKDRPQKRHIPYVRRPFALPERRQANSSPAPLFQNLAPQSPRANHEPGS